MGQPLRIPRPGPSGTGGADSHLTVRLDGPGPAGARGTILYLHGFGSSQGGDKAVYFRRRAVEDGFCFCSFDFQGHGESGGGMEGLTQSRNLEDVAAVHAELTRRGHGRPVVFGSSMGGAAALWYAARNAPEVAAVLAIAPALGLRERLEEWAGEEGLVSWRERGVRPYEDYRGVFSLGWGLMEDLAAYPTGELLECHRVPALLFQGKLDESVDWRGTVELATGCGDGAVELHLFADGDHRLVDRLDRLWGLAREFLAARLGV